ncbi:MAG: hypothetical protein LBJ17_01315, partial [Dysgonamonadaceae bacterium]|nr:hypothetical protein [Dysgonamonadaceae bacterium]
QSAPNKRGNYTITFSSTAATLTLSVLNLGTTETYQFSVNADKTTIYLNNVAYNKKTGTNPNPSVPEVFHAKPYLANIAMNASSGAITDIDALLIQSVTWGSLWYNIGGYINSLDDLLTDLKNRIETATGKEIAAIYASNVPNSNNNYPPVVENTPLGSIDADGTVNPTDPVVYILWDE